MDNNENNKKERNINIKKILYESVINNKGVPFSMITLFAAYWIQDVVFFGSFSKFTSDVPKFMENINFNQIALLIFPYILAEVLFYVNNIIVSHSIPQIELNVVEELTKQTLESIKTAKTIVNTNEYVMNLKKVIESKSVYYLFVSNVVPTILVTFGMVYYFAQCGTKIGIISMLIICIFLFVTVKMCSDSIYASYENEDAVNLMYDNIQDVMINSDLVITSNTIPKELDNMNIDKSYVYKTYLNSETTTSESSFHLRMLSLITIVILDMYAMYLYYNGEMKIDLVVSICTLSVIMLKYFNAMISRFRNSVGYIGKFYEIDDYFASFKIYDDQSDLQNLKISNGDIEFNNVTLNFGDKKIFDNFNFNIKGNTKVGIIGEMGKGKTTILKMLCGLLDYEGTILIDKQNIKKINYESVMQNIAYISQQPKMFNKNIYYNLSYGTNFTENDVNEFLAKLNFSDFFKLFPKGINTSVGKEGSKLSGGQKQLIAILRAMLQNKKIILLDEPTNSLDVQTKKIITELIKKINDKTVLIVTHDQSLLELFDDFIILK